MAVTGKYSTTWVGGAFLLGSALAALFCYMNCEKCQDPVRPELKMAAFFDEESINAMAGADGSIGARFYLARKSSGALTSLAGAIKEDGSHIPDNGTELLFRMFMGISGSATEMEMLKENDAVQVVRAANEVDKPTWSIEASSASLRALLSVPGCNAVGVLVRTTTDDDRTFDLVPVTLDGQGYVVLGELEDMRVGAPCPMHCPRDPAVYLHRRN